MTAEAHARRFTVALAGVTIAALAVRLAYLWQLHGSPLLSILMGDSRQYDEWAMRIAGGQWLGTDVFYQAPLYPYFLAVVYGIAGHDPGLVRIVQAFLGAVSCALLGIAGRRFFDYRTGIVAALLLALYPPAIFFDGLIQKSSLDILLITAILGLVAVFQDERRWKWLVALGAAASAFVLNRENARVIFPVVVAWLLFGFREIAIRRRAAWTAVFVAASLAVLLPVGLRNYRLGGEFLISTSQLGPNFYIGNNARASGSYDPLVPGRGDAVYEREDATRLASTAAGRALSPGEVSDYWLSQALAFIRSHPGRWLILIGKKLALTVNGREIADTESIEAYADYSWVLRGLQRLNFGVLLALAAFGCWVRRNEWRRHLILYGFFGALALSVVAFYVVARYRHPLAPIVLLFSAAALVVLADVILAWLRRRGEVPQARKDVHRLREGGERPTARRQARSWLPGVAIAGVVAIIANLPLQPVRDATWLNLGSMLVHAGRSSEAVAVLQRALADDPAYAEAHFNLGLAYRDTGQTLRSLEEFADAVRLKPDYADAHNAIGIALRDLGRPDEALARFREAARLAPDSVEAHTNLGLSLMEAGRTDEALQEQRRAVALAPDSASAHNNLGSAIRQAGDTGEAIAEYGRALALKADYPEAHANLALALASVGDFDGAFRHFDEALRLARASGQTEVARRIEAAVLQTRTLIDRGAR
jgi:tetratricopeptide (TPR) repeat protein